MYRSWRRPSIAGTVFGEGGDPLGQTQTTAWRFTMSNGVKRLQRTGGGTIDDRGAYRLFGLQPGDYLVSATVNNFDSVMSYRTLSDTALIEQAIAAGAVQASIVSDIQVRLAQASSIQGVLHRITA